MTYVPDNSSQQEFHRTCSDQGTLGREQILLQSAPDSGLGEALDLAFRLDEGLWSLFETPHLLALAHTALYIRCSDRHCVL